MDSLKASQVHEARVKPYRTTGDKIEILKIHFFDNFIIIFNENCKIRNIQIYKKTNVKI